jgi:hypothetical protein
MIAEMKCLRRDLSNARIEIAEPAQDRETGFFLRRMQFNQAEENWTLVAGLFHAGCF